MKKTIMMAAFLPILFVACQKEATLNTLNATATVAGSSETKTTYIDNGKDAQSALKVNWSDSESFKAYYTSTEYVVFSKSEGNTFTATDVPEGVTASTEFTGVYGEKATYNADGTVRINFSGQDGTLENLGKYDVMTCVSTTEGDALKFAFEHNCAILRVKLSTTSSESSDKNHLYIGFNNARLKGAGSGTSNITVVNNSSDGIAVAGNKVTFEMNFTGPIAGNDRYPAVTKTIYVAIPALEWNGLNYSSISSTYYRYNKTVDLKSTLTSIDAGKIYDVTAEYSSRTWGGEID